VSDPKDLTVEPKTPTVRHNVTYSLAHAELVAAARRAAIAASMEV
jgi:hypothetical protein